MTRYTVVHATADDWSRIAKSCADQLVAAGADRGLGFLYVTDHLAEDAEDLLLYLQEETGITDWVGTVGLGVAANEIEYFDRSGAVAMVMDLDPDSYCVIPGYGAEGDALPGPVALWVGAHGTPFGIIHGDPRDTRLPGLIEDLAGATSGFLVGGLAASRTTNFQVAGDLIEGGLSGVLFGPEVEVATGLSQGCTPIGPQHIVSDCLDNVIVGLDGRNALEVFKEEAGDLIARNLERAQGYINAAFPVPGADTGDFLVRNLAAIDQARGWLAIGGEVSPGERMMFVRRDPRAARSELNKMLTALKNRLPGPPQAALYVSCVARGPAMFGQEGHETAIIREVFGDLPLIGFLASGEISNGRLYGYTGVLTLFM